MTLTDVVVITGASNQHLTFTGRMPFLSPNQQCQSTEGKKCLMHGLAHPKLNCGSSNIVLGPQKDPGHLGGRLVKPPVSL